MKQVLLVIGLAGLIVGATMCPNIGCLIPKKYRRRYPAEVIRQAIYRLDKKGWIILKKKGDKWQIALSQQGRKVLLLYEAGVKHIRKPKKWDRKWRILIFDIPESRKTVRELIRKSLKNLSFRWIQDSVWIHPYECREVLELLRTRCGIRTQALYLRVETIDQEEKFKKYFHLT